MNYADLTPGRLIDCGTASMTESEIIAFATAYDPQWFHLDAARAGGGPYRGLIASGWHTCAVAMRLVADAVFAGSEAIGSPGLDAIRWKLPVRPGDTLTVRLEVLERRLSASKPDRGIVRHRWDISNQKGEVVTEIEGVTFYDLTR